MILSNKIQPERDPQDVADAALELPMRDPRKCADKGMYICMYI